MKGVILGGFLGSGKTTTLLSLARYLVETSTSDKEYKVMIIENEVGEISIDDTFISGSGLQVSTLFSGCACCTLSGELTSTAQLIQRDFDPEWLIIETTGVAYPRSMQESLEHAVKMRPKILVLSDAFRFERQLRAMRTLIEDQIVGSDAVLVNKIDLVDAEAADRVKSLIVEIEPNTQVELITANEGVDEAIWDAFIGERS
ncbi:MAG: cobalamin biosynthesis protein P47K [Coriobacteriia bacterium]|nr:cobalamin biosynthesis protein P47K [Coriobacteriia bacterium]